MTNSKKGTRAMIILAICASIIAFVISRNVFRVETGIIAINIGACLFAYFKMVGGMLFTQGWKVFNREIILGMPLVLFIYYIVLGIILWKLFMITSEMVHSTDTDFTISSLNILTLTISLSVGVLGSFVAWYCGIDDWMAGGSEYDARVELKSKRYSEEAIETKIAELRRIGILSPSDVLESEFV